MPGGFWGNGNSRPFRRRRSLLGRKIHSENDLPRQDSSPSLQQQQQQQQLQQLESQNNIMVLPDNVRTILIAGTPELWSLTTGPTTPYTPSTAATTSSNCDASLVTMGSELSPGATTIDEEEPYEGGLNWLLQTTTTTTSSNSKQPGQGRCETAKHQQIQSQQQTSTAQQAPSSMVVMYQSPSSPSAAIPPPQQALHLWLTSVEALLQSEEMSSLLGATQDMVKLAGGMAVRTAFLPVTLPLHVACATKDFVEWTVHQTISQTTGALLQLTTSNGATGTHDDDDSTTTATAQQKTTQNQQHKETSAQTQQEECKSPTNSAHNSPLGRVLQLIPVVLETAEKIKDEIGSTVIGIVTPPQHRSQDIMQYEKERLDRLKIPVFSDDGPNEVLPLPMLLSKKSLPASPTSSVTPADFSKYLLRVEDLGVSAPNNKAATVLFVDLSAEYRDNVLLKQCLGQLAKQGLALATTHAPAIPPTTPGTTMNVEWKPEGATAKLLRKKARQTPERWEEIMQSDILMWSGSFNKQCGGSPTHRQCPLFLARGTVDRKSPREFLEMLWNNNRTCEYNLYCLGREDVFQIDDQVLSSSSKQAHTGTKVVKSETRVPFTGLSVTLCTMMHCRPLPGGPQEGYMIVSRSLLSGMAGSHTSPPSFDSTKSSKCIQKSKSEILWGINVFRSVPGHPGQTELTSLSQVSSAMVPKFLSQKIGVMGVEDFFRNVRNPSPKVASSPDSTTLPPSDATPLLSPLKSS